MKAYLNHVTILSLPEIHFLSYSSASFAGMKINFHYGKQNAKIPFDFPEFHLRIKDLCNDAIYVFAYYYSSVSSDFASFLSEVEA